MLSDESDTIKVFLALVADEKREHEQYSGSGRKPMLVNESGLLRWLQSELYGFKS